MQDIARPNAALTIDPVTLEVIRHRLISITNQIDANIRRTAFSPYIYEYNDFAVGLADASGALIAQCTGGMPPFVADSVGMAVCDGLSIYTRERLHHGDVLLCNHAAVQGQHLNNTVMYTPICVGPDRATLIGFFAINVHWIDIAGAVPFSPDILARACSCARSSCGSATSRSRRSIGSSRTTRASRPSSSAISQRSSPAACSAATSWPIWSTNMASPRSNERSQSFWTSRRLRLVR